MKRRLSQALLLSAMVVSLSASSVVPVKGHSETIETGVAAQKEPMRKNSSIGNGASDVFYELLPNMFQASVVKRNEYSEILNSVNEHEIINKDTKTTIDDFTLIGKTNKKLHCIFNRSKNVFDCDIA